MRPKSPFTTEILVDAADIDNLGHVNNVIYLRYVQDVATAHWNQVAPQELKQQCSWVVLRHEIDYVSPALMGDVLIASTWVGKTEGVRSIRFVELKNKKTGRLIAKACTDWCMLDSITLKPKRINENIISLLQVHE
ncbi:MAG: acyl-CoA thioesterase [Cyclobacteriaceae bacterium]|nr:acyl-CoA thioesterase [Cyclobacteriaceae bacterium]